MATIRSIAKQANVSIATVSKVLNGKSGVKEETRQLILSIAQELNYRPNLNARSLKSGKARTIGIIAEDLTVFNTPEIIDGIAVACDNAGYHYILANLRLFKRFGHHMPGEAAHSALIREALDVLLSKQVAGVIYIGSHSHPVPLLCDYDEVPMVCAYCTCDQLPSVVYDDEMASYELTERLLARGDRRIGMITGPLDSLHSMSRARGLMRALFDHQIPYDPTLTFTGDWERDSGYHLAGRLLDAGVTAIYAQNDIMALGVLDCCSARGIDVGRDLRLIGFDNRDISQVCRPRLSTVALPLFEIGRTATEQILMLVSGEECPALLTKLPCTVVERESTLKTE
ncbi:MAG: LacI family DNA-binding transcriptional regulator [Oscillospiraceae bacterium]|nr:LacI family DNA-binding transcriptional regulator [Oscillospiraceae bacterium]MBR4655516.1 LacI family DNA-binding transcriptional regulator [Oscillospiraceae bacterium]